MFTALNSGYPRPETTRKFRGKDETHTHMKRTRTFTSLGKSHLAR
jgi:hypothetical protein